MRSIVDRAEPVQVILAPGEAKFRCVKFTNNGNCILVGDTDGVVTFYHLLGLTPKRVTHVNLV